MSVQGLLGVGLIASGMACWFLGFSVRLLEKGRRRHVGQLADHDAQLVVLRKQLEELHDEVVWKRIAEEES